ncbi:MAG: hypothetical protein WC476_09295 [Phycisphaerae bacterium]
MPKFGAREKNFLSACCDSSYVSRIFICLEYAFGSESADMVDEKRKLSREVFVRRCVRKQSTNTAGGDYIGRCD